MGTLQNQNSYGSRREEGCALGSKHLRSKPEGPEPLPQEPRQLGVGEAALRTDHKINLFRNLAKISVLRRLCKWRTI